MNYDEFLEGKLKRIVSSGFDPGPLPGTLFPFQQFCTTKALKAGRYALFEECGLGKTRQQIIFADKVVRHTNKPALILCPLAVSGQTIKEGENIGIEIKRGGGDIDIFNYEQLEKMDTSKYGCVVLDESSILKNFDGKYRGAIIDTFKNTPYKLACSATPSPNDDMELGNHSEFLNVMSRSEMLAMFFVHDGGETSKWRLKKHAESAFWKWVSSWAVSVSMPSDLGFSDEGYVLPELVCKEFLINTETKDGVLINGTSVSATDFNAELRRTKDKRLEIAASLTSSEQHLIWVKQNEEGDALRKMIPGSIEVKGDQPMELKEELLLAFAAGEIKDLITKTSIAALGMNFQNCHNTTFPSPDFSFEKTYQAIRRFLRFGQKSNVTANFIITDTMSNILTSFKRKQQQFLNMQKQMQSFMNCTQSVSNEQTKYKAKKIKLPSWIN